MTPPFPGAGTGHRPEPHPILQHVTSEFTFPLGGASGKVPPHPLCIQPWPHARMVTELTEKLGSQRGPERVRGSGFIPHMLFVLTAATNHQCSRTGTEVDFPAALVAG